MMIEEMRETMHVRTVRVEDTAEIIRGQDDKVEGMRAATHSHAVVFTEFVLDKELYSTSVFCFYEGEDVKYYEHRIERYCGAPYDKIRRYDCGGKDGVRKIHEMTSKDAYKDVRRMYFIDRDYWPLEQPLDDMYETPCYSLENFYTSKDAFKRILQCEFGMNPGSEDFNQCINSYNARIEEFHDGVLELNAWLKLQRLKEMNLGKRKVETNKIWLTKFIQKISVESVSFKNEINKKALEEIFSDAPFISDEEISIEKEEFNNTGERGKFFRGKYELFFLRKFIDDLKDKVKNGRGFSKKYTSINLDPYTNTLGALSAYADTPPTLIQFLENHKYEIADA